MEPNRNSVYRYGLFLLQWGEFETRIDYLITKELNITHKKGHIVSGSLPFGIKANILKSLLNDRDEPDKKGVDLITEVVLSAERNFLIHGIPTFHSFTGDLVFTKRTIANNIKVKEKTFTEDGLYEHLGEFIEAKAQMEDHFDSSKEDLLDFLVTARSLSDSAKT